MKHAEPVDIGDTGWYATKVGSQDSPVLLVSHKCRAGLGQNRIQKNTHRRHGIRWRCRACKEYAPKTVIAFMKLHELNRRVGE